MKELSEISYFDIPKKIGRDGDYCEVVAVENYEIEFSPDMGKRVTFIARFLSLGEEYRHSRVFHGKDAATYGFNVGQRFPLKGLARRTDTGRDSSSKCDTTYSISVKFAQYSATYF